MKKLIVLSVLVFSFTIVSLSFSQIRLPNGNNKFQMDIQLGKVIPTGSFSNYNGSDLYLGLGIGYNIAKNLDINMEFSLVDFPRKAFFTDANPPYTKILQFTIGVKPNLNVAKSLNLYSEIGGGLYSTTRITIPNLNEESKLNFGGNIGVGAGYTIANTGELFFETKIHNIFASENIAYYNLGGGFRILF